MTSLFDKAINSVVLANARYVLPKLNILPLILYAYKKTLSGERKLASQWIEFCNTYMDIHSGRKVSTRALENFYDLRFKAVHVVEGQPIEEGSLLRRISSYTAATVVLSSVFVSMRLKESLSQLYQGVTNLSKQLLGTAQPHTATVVTSPLPQAVQGQDVAGFEIPASPVPLLWTPDAEDPEMVPCLQEVAEPVTNPTVEP